MVINSGDLIYIPSAVRLYIKDGNGTIRDFHELQFPQSLLVTGIRDRSYEVFYKNKRWLVDKNKVYEA